MSLRSNSTTGTPAGGVQKHGDAAVRGMADRLSLAAAPTFAIMALLATLTGGGDMICSSTPDASPLNGMVVMYLLMSAFHLGPWFKFFPGRRSGARRS